MRIATLNTWKNDGDYIERLRLMKQQTHLLNPDILLLQEVFSTTDAEYNTARDIAVSTSMEYHLVEARIKNRSIQNQELMSSSGLAIVTSLPIIEHVGIELPSNELDGGRKAQIAIVNHVKGDLAIVNLHLSHLRDAYELRLAQLHEILAHPFVKECDQLIIAGDFNTQLESKEMQMLDAYGLKDSFALCNKICSGTSPEKNGIRKAIDFILIKSKDMQCIDTDITYNINETNTPLYPSDHLGVYADVL